MKRIFDMKTSDETTRGFDLDQIRSWLVGIQEIDRLKYFYYAPGSKYPTGSKNLKTQPVTDVLSFLTSHFTESPNSFVEIQRKAFISGRQEIISREITSKGEITKIAVLDVKKTK